MKGVAVLVTRLREEAEDAEVQQGMAGEDIPGSEEAPNDPETKKVKKEVETNGDEAKMDVDGGASTSRKIKNKPTTRASASTKGKKKDKIAEMGIVGQEARKMRIEARKKRIEEYKKNLEKNCMCSGSNITNSANRH